MSKYIKLFENHAQYETFIGGGGENTPFIRPNVSHCIGDNHVHYNPIPDYSKEYLTFVALEDGTFTFTPANNNVISYSLDEGNTWTDLAADTNTLTVTKGNKVLWRGEMTPTSDDGIGTFSSTGRFNVQGNIMSLLFGADFKGQTDLTDKNYAFYFLFNSNSNLVNVQNLSLPAETLADSCYSNMFNGCTSLTTAPELPAKTLATACYSNMFVDCTNLTTAPELPVITLTSNCYSYMFKGCTSLETAPTLPAETLAEGCYFEMFRDCTSLKTAPELPSTELASYCYENMFYGCTSLTTAPSVLPAETLANRCYYLMFYGCTGLVNAPTLPAETLADSCYSNMFNGCTNLTTAPELPAKTLATACYSYMFYGCTGLTRAPELPATTLTTECYNFMFFGCSSLNYIKAMFTTTPGTDYTYKWVSGVASSGTFVKNAAATWNVTGTSGIPTGWTKQTATK